MRLPFALSMLLYGEKKTCFDAGQRSVEMQIWMENEDRLLCTVSHLHEAFNQ